MILEEYLNISKAGTTFMPFPIFSNKKLDKNNINP